jgi:S1-C subfamily serine protease
MKLPQVGVALLVLSLPSYAWSTSPEGYLGDPFAVSAGAGAHATVAVGAAGAMSPAARAAKGGRASAARFSAVLGSLKPEGRSATRGAKEARVYQAASPAVVLIITDDALGSGVLVSADGKIITNLHVVEQNQEVGVVFKPAVEDAAIAPSDVHRARVIRRDEVADLALLQVSDVPSGIKPLTVGSATEIEVGSDVHAIGHPTGQSWTYTRGIVSQIRHDYAWAAQDKIKHKATVVQTQTPINPGNSGGPLLDDDLEVIGINSFIGDGEGINFAVSGDDVKAFLARTGDRVSEPVTPAKTKTASKSCKIKDLESRPSEDPKGEEFLIDADCDGVGDYVVVIPDDSKAPSLTLLDTTGSGKIDTVVVDEERDGKPEFAIYDTDGDGKSDLMGYYRPGEFEPYKWERLDE